MKDKKIKALLMREGCEEISIHLNNSLVKESEKEKELRDIVIHNGYIDYCSVGGAKVMN